MVFCSNCGIELPEDAFFCHKCGQMTEKGKASGMSRPEHPNQEWEREVENALSTAAQNIREGLEAAGEGIRETQYGWDRHRIEEVRSYSGEVTQGKTFFDAATFNGRISVSTWDKPEYNVELLVRASGRSNEEAQRNLEELKTHLEEQPEDDKLGLILMIDRPTERNRGYSVSLDVTLPAKAETDLRLRTSNGRISVDSLKGETLKMKTSNGRIELKDVEAKTIDCKTSNGKVLMNNVKAENIEGRTSNGSISGEIDASDVTLSTSNGKIDLKLTCSTSGRYRLRSSLGSINLDVSRESDVGYNLDLHTSMSSVVIDLPDLVYSINRRNEKAAKTTNYGDKERKIAIEASTSMGKIQVRN